VDRLLDTAVTGPLHLRRPEIAGLMRDQREFDRIARYVEMNPVKAGLVTAEVFLWSSARPIANLPDDNRTD
jgi:hypothetical protein